MRATRGATLVEALVAIAVLGIGTAAVSDLVTSISAARRKMAFQTTSLELFNRINAELQASTCLVFPNTAGPTALSTDPAFVTPAADTWQTTVPAGAAHLRTVGRFVDVVPAVRVDYQLRLVAPPAGLVNNPFAYDITVRIREITQDAATDAADVTSGHYVKTWPIRKICMYRATAASRGGFP